MDVTDSQEQRVYTERRGKIFWTKIQPKNIAIANLNQTQLF